ncbi:hypothetical protein ACTXT7_002525 [Hymenolepis weldensis]
MYFLEELDEIAVFLNHPMGREILEMRQMSPSFILLHIVPFPGGYWRFYKPKKYPQKPLLWKVKIGAKQVDCALVEPRQLLERATANGLLSREDKKKRHQKYHDSNPSTVSPN